MKKILMAIAAVLLCVSISAQDFGGQGGPGGMGPGNGMPPGGPKGERPMGPPPGDKKDKAPKKKEKKDKTFITVPQMYAYAVGVKDGDSVVYMSDMLILNNAKLEKKTKFLVYRNDYSAQFKNYLADNFQDKMRTCAVIFNRKLKALSKDYDNLKKKYIKHHLMIKVVDQTQFRFIVPED